MTGFFKRIQDRKKEKLIINILIHKVKSELAIKKRGNGIRKDGSGLYRQPELLFPATRKLAKKLQANLTKRGIRCLFSDTYRTSEMQEKLYRQQKTKARANQSMHNYGLAFHLTPFKEGSKTQLEWSASHYHYEIMQEEAEKLGLTSGRRWNDSTHFSHNILTGNIKNEDSVWILKGRLDLMQSKTKTGRV